MGAEYRHCMLYCCTEMTTEQEIFELADALGEVAQA
jgi:hypothetical protein